MGLSQVISSFFRWPESKEIRSLKAERDALTSERNSLRAQAECAQIRKEDAPTMNDIMVRLTSISDWQKLINERPEIVDSTFVRDLADKVEKNGITSHFLGKVPSSEVSQIGTVPREHLMVRGLNSRQRALLDLLVVRSHPRAPKDVAVYAHEATTPLAMALRGRFPRFLGSEYVSDPKTAAELFPIPIVDILSSNFPDRSFDFILSADVMEHVPSIAPALKDTARILKDHGHFLATMPFLHKSEHTLNLAEIINGKIVHHLDPIFHGNPIDPSGGSLVFNLPGWDILDLARESGFSSAEWLFWCSEQNGIVGEPDCAGVMILHAVK